jgi:preprotein translocase SecE subunit
LRGERTREGARVSRIRKFLAEAFSELRKVAWPTAHQVRVLTVLVFGASLLVGFYIAFWDLLFTEILKLINPA